MARKSRKAQAQFLRENTAGALSQVDRRLRANVTPIERITRYVIPGPPRPKARTRAFAYKNKKTGKVGVAQWTPENTRVFERGVSEYCAEQHPALVPFSGRLSLAIIFKVSALRGDLDNLAKAVLDGMQKVSFQNDSQIDELWLRRIKVESGEECTEVAVRPYSPNLVHFCKRCGDHIDINELVLTAEAVPF